MRRNQNANDFTSDGSKRSLMYFAIMIVVGMIFILGYLMITGNTPQVFTDVVQEYTSLHSSNKSAERNLFYIASILGILAYAIYYFRVISKRLLLEENIATDKDDKGALYVVIGLLVFTATLYFVYSATNWLLITGTIIAFILYVIDKKLTVLGTTFLFITAYAFCGIYRIYVVLGGLYPLSMMTVSALSAITLITVLAINDNCEQSLLKGTMIMQLFVPFTLFVFLNSTYAYGEEIISVHIPYRIQILIYVLVVAFSVEAAFNIKSKWNKEKNLGKLISYGLCISIMAFNRYSGTGSIVPADVHHPFENIIGYSQIFELGQKAFSEYIPISGMYSVVQGWFLAFFGHGYLSFYHLTENIFYLFIIVLIVIFLKKQLTGEWVFLIALIFYVMDYNRVALVVPIMLLLSMPELIERKNLWLKAWYLSSFINGLYYPVFGAAVCIGFMPLGIWQIVTYAKSGELKQDIKTIKFWIWWIVCSVPAVAGAGLLLGTVKHMRAMGDQTVYADGITRFGQTVPNNFLSYLQQLPIRLIVYYIFSYLIVVALVWLSFVLFLRNGNIQISEKKHLVINDPVPGFLSLSVGLLLLVSFTYTVIRFDITSIYARSAGVVYASFTMLLLLISRYMNCRKNRFWVYGFAIFIIAVVSAEGFAFMESNSKLSAHYTVPDGYVHVTNDQISRFGDCFVERGVYDAIENAYNYYNVLNMEADSLGVFDYFGYYYMCNAGGDSVIEASTIKGYGAAEETVELIRKNETIVGSNISSVDNYYFYYWLVNSGEYIWDFTNRVFRPNDGSVSLETIREENKYIDLSEEGAGLGRTASSWGLSVDTLEDIFTNTDIEVSTSDADGAMSLIFEESVNGNDADFIYLEFANQDQNYQYTLFDLEGNYDQGYLGEKNILKKLVSKLLKKDYNPGMMVVVSWLDEVGNTHSMNCSMGQGKLLIPIGSGRGWLLNEHSEITITVKQGEETITVPDITSVRMLKLREVG